LHCTGWLRAGLKSDLPRFITSLAALVEQVDSADAGRLGTKFRQLPRTLTHWRLRLRKMQAQALVLHRAVPLQSHALPEKLKKVQSRNSDNHVSSTDL
jgi:hypothetical protein